jgi:hypothetical protein
VLRSFLVMLLVMTGCQASSEFPAQTSDPNRFEASMRYEFHSTREATFWTGVEIDLFERDHEVTQYTLNFESVPHAQELFDAALERRRVRASIETFTLEDPNVFAQMRITASAGSRIQQNTGVAETVLLTGDIRLTRYDLEGNASNIVVVYFNHEVPLLRN